MTFEPAGEKETWLVCAVYGPLSGDIVGFWEDLLTECAELSKSFNTRSIVILGDLNIHLEDLFDHSDSCSCSHCHRKAADKKVASLLRARGFRCMNPRNTATHVSGTCIDLILTTAILEAVVHVLKPGDIASSDHSLVHTTLPVNILSWEPCR